MMKQLDGEKVCRAEWTTEWQQIQEGEWEGGDRKRGITVQGEGEDYRIPNKGRIFKDLNPSK